jgi:aspartate racemase
MADWSKYPMDINVHWPINEKVIGVLGFSPIAVSNFLSYLVNRQVDKEWQYPRILIDIDSKVPSRGRYLELGETDPVPFIKRDIELLCEKGADFVVIPCNTVHILYERFALDSPIPIPHIIDVTYCAAVNAGISRPVVLCSLSTANHGLYQQVFKQAVRFPKQALVSEGIEAVKRNARTEAIAEQILQTISAMDNVDGVIYGCTEVGVLMQSVKPKLPIVDSTKELADFCFMFANSSKIDSQIRLYAK